MNYALDDTGANTRKLNLKQNGNIERAFELDDVGNTHM